MLSAITGFIGWFILFIITIIILIIRTLKAMGKRNFKPVLLMLIIAISSMFLGHSKLMLVLSWFIPIIAQWVFPKFFEPKTGGLFGGNKMKSVPPQTPQSSQTVVPPITVVPQITNITKSGGASAPAYNAGRTAPEQIKAPTQTQAPRVTAQTNGSMSLEEELKILDAKINQGDFKDDIELEAIVKRRRAIMDTLGL